MPHETTGVGVLTLMIVVKTAILVLGALVTYFSYKAYRRTGDPSLQLLAGGFGLITFGALLGGMVHEVIQADLAVGVLIEGIFVMVGLSLVAFSLKV